MPSSMKVDKPEVFNDWPNDIGFEHREEQTTPVELQISGTIPDYVSGVLYRAATAGNAIQPKDPNKPILKLSHWFDGFGQVHRFEIKQNPTRVIHNSRFTSDALVNKIRETGKIDHITFGQKRDPCMSLFAKFRSVFRGSSGGAADPTGNTEAARSGMNISVTVSTDIPGLGENNGLVIKTDTTWMHKINPETLEPIGYASQTVLHPELTGPFSSAHARSDPETGDFFNFNLDLSPPVPTWRIFKVDKITGRTEILARIRDKVDAPGSYIHSFFLTEKYVILCVWNSKFAWNGTKLLWERNVLDGIADWDPHGKCVFFVVDRREGRGLVKKFQTEKPFFAFHSTNSWEDKDGGVVCEMPVYDDLDVLKRFYYENMLAREVANGKGWLGKGRSTIGRWRLPNIEDGQEKGLAECEWQVGKEWGLELPTINPKFTGKESRYIYGITSIGKSNFMDGIIKYDTQTGAHKLWQTHAQTPGEAIFIPDPKSEREDDGVLLSIVLDGLREKSYLLVLDARTLEEVGRAEVNGVVGFAFHGKFVNLVNQGKDIET